MFCRNCGTKLAEGSKFCNKCGTKVIVNNIVEETVQNNVVEQQIIYQEEKSFLKQNVDNSKLYLYTALSVIIPLLLILVLR